MPPDDFAILVGISTYRQPEMLKTLDGPANDIALMKQWLVDPAGGDIPDDRAHIAIIQSDPEKLASVEDPYDTPPVFDDFNRVFLKLSEQRRDNRLRGRLYLYFSGHGFCNRQNNITEAALYAANATRDYASNIFGTAYARQAKGKPLFKETVLIMDCCRTSVINSSATPPAFSGAPDETLSKQAHLMEIYAAPKGGSAQERKIPERGDKVYGLLTHALIKALEEARPTSPGAISSTALRNLILQSWDSVCGPKPPDKPEIILPGSGDIEFPARNSGAEFAIRFITPQPSGTTIFLRDWKLRKFAHLSATGDAADDLTSGNGPLYSYERQGIDLMLRLQPGLYEYVLSSGPSGTIQIPGDKDVTI